MITHEPFSIDVSYGQIAIFDGRLIAPYNDWQKQHIAQGFAWRNGSVSFTTIEEDGTHQVFLDGCCEVDERHLPDRAIKVPFDVPAGGLIEIGSISDTKQLIVMPGKYQLLFQYFVPKANVPPTVHFSLFGNDAASFSILRADDALNPGRTLLLDASPA